MHHTPPHQPPTHTSVPPRHGALGSLNRNGRPRSWNLSLKGSEELMEVSGGWKRRGILSFLALLHPNPHDIFGNPEQTLSLLGARADETLKAPSLVSRAPWLG